MSVPTNRPYTPFPWKRFEPVKSRPFQAWGPPDQEVVDWITVKWGLEEVLPLWQELLLDDDGEVSDHTIDFWEARHLIGMYALPMVRRISSSF
jgi:hypothetical protein